MRFLFILLIYIMIGCSSNGPTRQVKPVEQVKISQGLYATKETPRGAEKIKKEASKPHFFSPKASETMKSQPVVKPLSTNMFKTNDVIYIFDQKTGNLIATNSNVFKTLNKEKKPKDYGYLVLYYSIAGIIGYFVWKKFFRKKKHLKG